MNRAGGQLEREVGALFKSVGCLDRQLEIFVAVAAQAQAGVEDALEHPVDRKQVSDRAGRAEHDMLGADADRERRGAEHLGGVLEAAIAGRGVGATGVGEHDAQLIQARTLLADEHRRGRCRARGEARRADRLLAVADEHPQVVPAAGLDAARDARGPEAVGQPAVRAEIADVVGRRHPARTKERLGPLAPVAFELGTDDHGAAPLTADPRSRCAQTSG